MQERIESLQQAESDCDNFEELVNITIGLALGYLMQGAYNDEGKNFTTEDQPYRNNELEEKENIVIVYHYFRGVSFEDIRDILDVTKGRVSQLHTGALNKIRMKLRKHTEVDQLV